MNEYFIIQKTPILSSTLTGTLLYYAFLWYIIIMMTLKKNSSIIHSVIQQNKDQPSEGCVWLLYSSKE